MIWNKKGDSDLGADSRSWIVTAVIALAILVVLAIIIGMVFFKDIMPFNLP